MPGFRPAQRQTKPFVNGPLPGQATAYPSPRHDPQLAAVPDRQQSSTRAAEEPQLPLAAAVMGQPSQAVLLDQVQRNFAPGQGYAVHCWPLKACFPLHVANVVAVRLVGVDLAQGGSGLNAADPTEPS